MSDPISDLLRRHDPAAGKELTSLEKRTMLRVAAGVVSPAGRRRSALVPALAFLLVAIVVLSSPLIRRLRPAPPSIAEIHAAPRNVRQVQYATRGGTRIIWALDPNFHM